MSQPAPVAPNPPPRIAGLPLLGPLLDLRNDPLALFLRASKMGDVVRANILGKQFHMLFHPDHAKRVLVDRYKIYGKQTRGYAALREALGLGLVTSEGELWRRQRRIAQPSFHHHRIAGFAALMSRATSEMLEHWDGFEPGHVIDLDAELMRLTLRIVGQCLMSTDLSDESGEIASAMATMLRQTIERITNPLSLPLSVPTPKNVRMRRSIERLDQLVLGVIRARRERPGPTNDLLAMFMEERDEETGERMNDRQLRDEVMTMVTAGHETTSNALTWAFYLLSDAPAVQQKLLAELDQVLGGREPSLADLPNLRYTEAVMKEAMRLFPPVWVIARSVHEDDVIDGHLIPKGSIVFISQWVAHRDPRFWRDPERFDPERFYTDEVEDLPKLAYFPFASGPRVCIGNNFAIMETKLLLAAIAQRHRLTLVPGHPVVPEPTITVRPKHGMRMTLSPAHPIST